jgi:hypothetical protein
MGPIVVVEGNGLLFEEKLVKVYSLTVNSFPFKKECELRFCDLNKNHSDESEFCFSDGPDPGGLLNISHGPGKHQHRWQRS